eukprot:scaffold156534_cov16-Tisochrysis_lutea.AAC.1
MHVEVSNAVCSNAIGYTGKTESGKLQVRQRRCSSRRVLTFQVQSAACGSSTGCASVLVILFIHTLLVFMSLNAASLLGASNHPTGLFTPTPEHPDYNKFLRMKE